MIACFFLPFKELSQTRYKITVVAVDVDMSSGIILEIEEYERALLTIKKYIKDSSDINNPYVYSIFTLHLVK